MKISTKSPNELIAVVTCTADTRQQMTTFKFLGYINNQRVILMALKSDKLEFQAGKGYIISIKDYHVREEVLVGSATKRKELK